MDISVVVTQQRKGYAVIVIFCHHSHTTCHTTSVSLSTYCDITMATTVTTILVKEVVSMQMANMADHVSGKYYTVSTCGHSLIHVCKCM